MGIAARKMKVALPADLAIDAEVDLCKTGDDYFIQARLARPPEVLADRLQALRGNRASSEGIGQHRRPIDPTAIGLV